MVVRFINHFLHLGICDFLTLLVSIIAQIDLRWCLKSILILEEDFIGLGHANVLLYFIDVVGLIIFFILKLLYLPLKRIVEIFVVACFWTFAANITRNELLSFLRMIEANKLFLRYCTWYNVSLIASLLIFKHVLAVDLLFGNLIHKLKCSGHRPLVPLCRGLL